MININFGEFNFGGNNQSQQEMQQMSQMCASHPECKDCPADKKIIQIGQSSFRCETSFERK